MTTTSKPRRSWGANTDLIAGVVVFVLISSLIQISLRAEDHTPADSAPNPSTIAIVGYWALAATTIGILIVGFGFAVSQTRILAILAYPVVGVITVGTVLLFSSQVPLPAPIDEPLPSRPACYGPDSEGCVGG